MESYIGQEKIDN